MPKLTPEQLLKLVELKVNKDLAKSMSGNRVEVKGEKGDDGKTPQKGIDYWTENDVKELVRRVMSNITLPVKGKDYFTEDEIDDIVKKVKALIPEPEKVVVNYDKIISEVTNLIPIPEDGEDGSPDTPEEVRDKLESLKGENRLDAFAIKNLEDYLKESETIKFVGGGGSSLTVRKDGAIVGSGTAINFTGSGVSSVTHNGNTATVTINTGATAWGDITGTQSDVNVSGFTNDAGYITASSTDTLTNKSGNISQWTNDSGYLTSYTETQTLQDVTDLGATTTNPISITNTSTQLSLKYDASNSASFTVGSSGKLNISPSGSYLGLNTSPDAAFHIKASAGTSAQAVAIRLEDTQGSNSRTWELGNASDSNYGTLYLQHSTTLGGSPTSNIMQWDDNGKVGIGAWSTAPSAFLQIRGTTEQLRLDYDASNYMSITTGSSGSTTFNLTGTTPTFTFSKGINVTGNLLPTGHLTSAGYLGYLGNYWRGVYANQFEIYNNGTNTFKADGTGTWSVGNTRLVVDKTTGRVSMRNTTTDQLRVEYDSSNYLSVTVNSAGNLTIEPTGGLTFKSNSLSTGSGIVFEREPDLATNNRYSILGVTQSLTANSPSANASFTAIEFSPRYTGSGTLNTLYGAFYSPINFSTGTVTTLVGSTVWARNASTGTVGSIRGISVDSPQNNGTISGTVSGLYVGNQGLSGVTNSYGLFVASQSGSTNSYGVYVGGGKSYFGGDVGIGTTSPSAALHVIDTGEQYRNGYDTSNYLSLTTGSAGDTDFGINGTDYMRLTNDGALLVGTTSESASKFYARDGGLSSGKTARIAGVTTTPNAGDVALGVIDINYNISASSATNNLVARPIAITTDNNLTGGGAEQNLRTLEITHSTQTSTTTSTIADIYIQNGTANGTVTTQYGMFIAGMQGTNKFAIYDDVGTNWVNNTSGTLIIGGTSRNASAKVQIDSTTQGFLPPRMTTTQKNAISSPATGLVVYDTTLNKLAVYTGSGWETVTSI